MYASPVYKFYNALQDTSADAGGSGPLRQVNGGNRNKDNANLRKSTSRVTSKLGVQNESLGGIQKYNARNTENGKIAWNNETAERSNKVPRQDDTEYEISLPGSPIIYKEMALKSRTSFESQSTRLARVEQLLFQAKIEYEKDQHKRQLPISSPEGNDTPSRDESTYLPSDADLIMGNTSLDNSPVACLKPTVAWDAFLSPDTRSSIAEMATPLKVFNTPAPKPTIIKVQSLKCDPIYDVASSTMISQEPTHIPSTPIYQLAHTTPYNCMNYDMTSPKQPQHLEQVYSLAGSRPLTVFSDPPEIKPTHNPEKIYALASGRPVTVFSQDDDEDTGSIDLDNDAPSNQESSLIPYLDVSGTVHSANMAMHQAALTGDSAQLAILLDAGGNINGCDSEGRSPLMYSVHYEQFESTMLLIARGANLNHQAIDGSTSLHYAGFRGSETMVALLLHAGAHPKMVDNDGRTAVHWATHNPSAQPMLALLESASLDEVNLVDTAGMTPLMWACYYNQSIQVQNLLKCGGNSALKDMDGKTALHWSVKKSSTACLKRLLTYENSFDVDTNGKTVIHYAAETGSKRAIKAIVNIRPGAVNDIDNNHRTPAHWAAVCNHPLALNTLGKLGSSFTTMDLKFRTPFDYAQACGFEKCCAVMSAVSNNETATICNATRPEICRPLMVSIPLCNYNSTKDDNIPEAVSELARLLSIGAHLSKFTNNAKGQAHTRFFWLNVQSFEVCWVKSAADLQKETYHRFTSSITVHKVKEGADRVITKRSDYDPQTKHKYCFYISDEFNKRLYLTAPSEDVYMMWTRGLTYLKGFAPRLHKDGVQPSSHFLSTRVRKS